MPSPTIAFLYPGAMGASLARVLHVRQPGYRLITSVDGRSSSSRERAQLAGLTVLPLPQVVAEADIILSILPPSAAVALASQVADLLAVSPRDAPPIYVDANAISPATAEQVAVVLGDSVPLVDGCIIGLPARDNYEPKVYLASAPKWAAQLRTASLVLRGIDPNAHELEAPNGGLRVVEMRDAGAGAASALKMAYGGLAKGYIGLGATLVLTANAHSPATAEALMVEMSDSAPDRLRGLSNAFHDMLPKAYRWVGEMEEVASFVSSTLTGAPHAQAPAHPKFEPHEGISSLGADASPSTSLGVGDTFEGLARMFERIAADLRATGKAVGGAAEGPTGDAAEVATLTDWARRSAALLEAKLGGDE